jgi:hypothetical protein
MALNYFFAAIILLSSVVLVYTLLDRSKFQRKQLKLS